MLSQFSMTRDKIDKLIGLASTIHDNWESSWSEIERDILSRGQSTQCKEGCNDCCFTQNFCSLSEGLLLTDYMRKNFSSERQERFRLLVESNVSSLRKLREDNACDSENDFQRSGGMECPFLEKGKCAIYSVRPLDCRAQIVTSQIHVDQCRQRPKLACCNEVKEKNIQLQKELQEKERALVIPPILDDWKKPLISETVSFIWNSVSAPPTFQVTKSSWEERLKSRGTFFDQTWQDDRHDFYLTSRFPLILPEEGEYPPDLIVVKIKPEVHQIYDEFVKYDALNELRVLYKLLPGASFDWGARVFRIENESKNKESHIVWMGDSFQERLMMWEAAKRCRGKVLCGGLGMGIFPQYALSLPRVESVRIVDMDKDVISLIENTWSKNPWLRNSDCAITHSKIERYLEKTMEKFDTVYIDTWDALTEEYLPHINYLLKLSKRVLKPGGEIIFWGYDLMIRLCLNQARNILNRREYFLAADKWQLKTLSKQYPLFHKLVRWFKNHPECTDDDLYSETYRLAINERKNMGTLSLSKHFFFGK